MRCVEQGSDLVFAYHLLKFVIVNYKLTVPVSMTYGRKVKLKHLTYLLVKGHFPESAFHVILNLGVVGVRQG